MGHSSSSNDNDQSSMDNTEKKLFGYYKILYLYCKRYFVMEPKHKRALVCKTDQKIPNLYKGWYWDNTTNASLKWKFFSKRAYKNFITSEYTMLYEEIIKAETNKTSLPLKEKQRIIRAFKQLKFKAKTRIPINYFKNNKIDPNIIDIDHVITIRESTSFHKHNCDIYESSKEIKLEQIIENSPFDEEKQNYFHNKQSDIKEIRNIKYNGDTEMKESTVKLTPHLMSIINAKENNSLKLQKEKHQKLKLLIETNFEKGEYKQNGEYKENGEYNENVFTYVGKDKDSWHSKIAEHKPLPCAICNGPLGKTRGYICVFGSKCAIKTLMKEIQLSKKYKNKSNNGGLNCCERCSTFFNFDGIPVCNADLYTLQLLRKECHSLYTELKLKYQRNINKFNSFVEIEDVLKHNVVKVVFRSWGKWWIQLIGQNKKVNNDYECYAYFDLEQLPHILQLFNKRQHIIDDIDRAAKDMRIKSLHSIPCQSAMSFCKPVTITADDLLHEEDRNKFKGSYINVIQQCHDGHVKPIESYYVNYPYLSKIIDLLIKILIIVKLVSVEVLNFTHINGYDYEYEIIQPNVGRDKYYNVNLQTYTIKENYTIYWDGFNLKYFDYFSDKYEIPISKKDKYTPKKIEKNPIFEELMHYVIDYFNYSMEFNEACTQILPQLIKFHYPLDELKSKYDSHNMLISILQYIYDRMLRHCDAKQCVQFETMGDNLMHWLPNKTCNNFNALFQIFNNVKQIVQRNGIITKREFHGNVRKPVETTNMSNISDIKTTKNTIEFIHSEQKNSDDLQTGEYKLFYTGLDKKLCLNNHHLRCKCGDGSMDLPCPQHSGNIFAKQGLLFSGHLGTNINGSTCLLGIRVQDLESNQKRVQVIKEKQEKIYKRKNNHYISSTNRNDFSSKDKYMCSANEPWEPPRVRRRINIDEID
eukprot:473428_1